MPTLILATGIVGFQAMGRTKRGIMRGELRDVGNEGETAAVLGHSARDGAAAPDVNGRLRHDVWTELALAVMPTATILGVLGMVELLAHERLLFASLASSALLVYLDPHHETNRVRSVVVSQLGAMLLGIGFLRLLGPGCAASALAMASVIAGMVVCRIMHPPAASTAMGFAFQRGEPRVVALFVVAVGLVAALVIFQRAAVRWALRIKSRERTSSTSSRQHDSFGEGSRA